jgi:hypothetical protein
VCPPPLEPPATSSRPQVLSSASTSSHTLGSGTAGLKVRENDAMNTAIQLPPPSTRGHFGLGMASSP